MTDQKRDGADKLPVEEQAKNAAQEILPDIREAVELIFRSQGYGTIVLEFDNYHIDTIGVHLTKKPGRKKQGRI